MGFLGGDVRFEKYFLSLKTPPHKGEGLGRGSFKFGPVFLLTDDGILSPAG
jgi:hypothetical protein